MTFNCHCLFISSEYHSVLKFVANGSKGLMSRKVEPSDSSHAMKAISIKSQLKCNSCP
jgi:hypothetical protein